jgi:hypothetical protein
VRKHVPLVAFALAFGSTLGIACAEVPGRVDVRADAVGFYLFSDSAWLAADGHVTIHAGSRTIVADSARYDLRKNRLLATGNVRVSGRGDKLSGAAYALDLPSGSATLLRAEPIPSTLTLHADELRTAVVEAPKPETFAALDLSDSRPYIRSRHAILAPNANLRMSPAEFPASSGTSLALPTFLYTLASNQNFGQSAMPGAMLDQSYTLFGTANSMTAAHLRYDGQNAVTLGMDERLVGGNNAYLVASILPLRDRQIDINAFQQLLPGLQQNFNADHIFGQYASDYARYQLQWSEREFRTTFAASQSDSSQTADLILSTYDRWIPHFFQYKLSLDYGFDRSPGALPFAKDFRLGPSAYVQSPTARLPLGFNASARYDYTFLAYDYPHEVTNGTLSFNFSRSLLGSPIRFNGTASFQQIDSRYRDDPMQYLSLPNPEYPYYAPDGTLWPGYFAYDGLTTLRTYSGQWTYQRRGDNQIQFTAWYTDDFPQFHGYGRPPLSANLSITERLSSMLKINLGRSYYFGWNKQYLSPQWTFSVSP